MTSWIWAGPLLAPWIVSGAGLTPTSFPRRAAASRAAQSTPAPVNAANPADYLQLKCFAPPDPITRLGNLGRNSVIGPGLSNLDVSLFKNTAIKRISEHFNAQFRVEIFNIFNRANFAPPLDHRSIFDENGKLVPGAGLIDATSTPSRQIQFGLKLIW